MLSCPSTIWTSLQPLNVRTLHSTAIFSQKLKNHHLVGIVPLFPSYLLINSTSLLQLYSLLILRNLDVSTGHFLTVVDTGERLPDQSCGLTQTRLCHGSFICPVSPSGKQRFRELLCFPFTEMIRIKMNEGLFLLFFCLGAQI